MRSGVVAFAGLALAVVFSLPASAAAPRYESRYMTLADCQQVHVIGSNYARARRGSDWALYKCEGKGGGEVWRDYTDGVHMRLGFGTLRNLSGSYAPDRRPNWPIEWRGTTHDGAFKPFAAIVRVSKPDDTSRSHLVIFRLRDDGTSCVIGEADNKTENEKARQIADAAFVKFHCLEEPFLP